MVVGRWHISKTVASQSAVGKHGNEASCLYDPFRDLCPVLGRMYIGPDDNDEVKYSIPV